MNYTEEDLEKALDELLIKRGEHPTRVRNPLYGEERELAKNLVKLFFIPDVMPCYLTAAIYHQEGDDIILRQDSDYKVIAKYRDMYCIVDEINELSVFNADYFNKA